MCYIKASFHLHRGFLLGIEREMTASATATGGWVLPLNDCLPHRDREGTSFHYIQGMEESRLNWHHFLPFSMATLFSALLYSQQMYSCRASVSLSYARDSLKEVLSHKQDHCPRDN